VTIDGMRFDPLEAIRQHSLGIADAAEGNLSARVEHCPEWDVAALVAHVIEVHWFWGAIVEERLQEPPSEDRRPERPAAEELVPRLVEGAERLIAVLGAADQSARVWTWAPAQQDVAFVTRHQVQEAAVHHFDAANAAGQRLEIPAAVAEDSIEEFLTFSVASEVDPASPPPPRLNGRLVLQCSGAGPAWMIGDHPAEGALRVAPGADEGVPTITASASDLLLWLYGRVSLDVSHVPPDLIERFRRFCFTD
jgi:uncharacterized protein (TIGR03083 family)